MANPIARFYHWLHGQWPAGTVERLPVVGDNGTTNVPRVRIAGDLTGIPLLKFAAETGVQAVRGLADEFTADSTARIKTP